MGSSPTLPSREEVEKQSKKNENKITQEYKTPKNVQNLNLGAPPIQNQDIYPINNLSLENNNTSPEKINKPANYDGINNQKPLQRQPRLNQSIPISNNPRMQYGTASPYQPIIVSQGVPIVNPGGYPLTYNGYPYPNYGPASMLNTVVVLPPGYKPDNNIGYAPWGDLGDDLRNLF